MPEAASALTAYGPIGCVAAILLFLLIQKDRELTKERAARINDAKSYTDLALSLQKQVLETSGKLIEGFKELRERNDEEARRRTR